MTKQNNGTAWAIGLFIFIMLLGLVLTYSGGTHWGTHDFALDMSLTSLLAGAVAAALKGISLTY
ncbi:hypothetical protein ACEV6Q_04060 [Enterobacter ludwigii]|uniref:hypothetical protein n=1 Tax=Enterobacter ludwigii TaxID=299767 RepID=UPI003BEF2F1F